MATEEGSGGGGTGFSSALAPRGWRSGEKRFSLSSLSSVPFSTSSYDCTVMSGGKSQGVREFTLSCPFICRAEEGLHISPPERKRKLSGPREVTCVLSLSLLGGGGGSHVFMEARRDGHSSGRNGVPCSSLFFSSLMSRSLGGGTGGNGGGGRETPQGGAGRTHTFTTKAAAYIKT